MEYSKEDLMEAKKQIWGVGENMGTEESNCLLYTSPSPRDGATSRMPSSA